MPKGKNRVGERKFSRTYPTKIKGDNGVPVIVRWFQAIESIISMYLGNITFLTVADFGMVLRSRRQPSLFKRFLRF